MLRGHVTRGVRHIKESGVHVAEYDKNKGHVL
jgi:hypothetical protein